MTFQDTISKFVDQLTGGFAPEQDNEPDTIIDYETDGNRALQPKERQNTTLTVVEPTKVAEIKKNSTEVIICEPRTYDESVEFVKYLKDKKSIIVNLNFLDATQARRLVDFLCGATHALNGNQSKISENVFIFTPMNVSLSAEAQNNKMVKDMAW